MDRMVAAGTSSPTHTHFDLLELEVSQPIHSQCFECSMENRDATEPLQEPKDSLGIDQESGEK